MNKRAWVIIGVVAGVVAATATVVGVFVSRGGDDTSTKTNQTGNGNSNCTSNGPKSKTTCTYPTDPHYTSEQAALNASKKYRGVEPEGPGPYPFVVVRTADIGVKVRSTPVENAIQLGGIAQLHPAWIICQTNSGFDPDPTTGNGDRWFKLKWPETKQSSAYFESQPSSAKTGWAYAYYFAPVAQNGTVPTCK